MNQPDAYAMSTAGFWGIVAIFEGLHPAAACGAAFGCFFFLSFPDPDQRPLIRKIALLFFSWGVGYSLGTAAAGSKDWGAFAMFIAICGSALSATVFGVLNLMVHNNSDLPKWLSKLLDRLPFTKSRTPDEPQ